MDIIAEAFNNAIMQSMVIGPIMGIVFGVIFSGLTEKPAINAPVTVVQTKNVFVTKISQQRSGRRSSSKDDEGLVFAIVFAVGFVVWKYAAYVGVIHYYMSLFLLSAIAFSFASVFSSAVRGVITSRDWIAFLISPIVLLSACLYLFNLAHSTFSPEITDLANKNNVFEFYFNALSDYGVKFVVMHVLGVTILMFVVILVVMSQLHYLSLMNQRSYGFMQSFWLAIARVTNLFSSKWWLFLSSLLLLVSYLAINPRMAALWLSN